MTEPATQNNGEAARNPNLRPFKPGQSGNPSGRPKGLARRVREMVGTDGEALVLLWQGVLTGYVTYQHPTGRTTTERVSVSDRIAVSKIVAERGWGKPAAYAPIEDDDPLDLANRMADEVAVEFDARLDEVAAARERREATQQPPAE